MFPTFLLLLFTSLACALDDNSITESPSSSTSISTPSSTSTSASSSSSTSSSPLTSTLSSNSSTATITTESSNVTTEIPAIGCTCGVFLSGQFKKGSKDQPKGNAALLHELPEAFPCSNVGNKMCTNKCLDVIVKHLPNSPTILCGSIDRDCHKERAYLFVKNCKEEWVNTNLSAGREYCCKDGHPYKCPLLS